MTQEVQIRRENVLPAPPEQVWSAVATGAGNLGWLFPMEIEPWEGGTVSRGPCTVTVWKPPQHFVCRYEGADGFTASLEYAIEPHGSGRSILCSVIGWVNSGVVDDLWDMRVAAASQSCDFYYHTLAQYLRYFSGRAATYVEVDQPAATGAGGFTGLRRRLGVADDAVEGDAVQLTLPGLGPLQLSLDYLAAHFIGLRGSDGLYCFIGREAWGWPIGLRHHLFAEDIDQERTEEAWRLWLEAALA